MCIRDSCDTIEKIGVSFLISGGAIPTAAVRAVVEVTRNAVPDSAALVKPADASSLAVLPPLSLEIPSSARPSLRDHVLVRVLIVGDLHCNTGAVIQVIDCAADFGADLMV